MRVETLLVLCGSLPQTSIETLQLSVLRALNLAQRTCMQAARHTDDSSVGKRKSLESKAGNTSLLWEQIGQEDSNMRWSSRGKATQES